MNKDLTKLLAAFTLMRDQGREVIVHKKTGIKVQIFHLAAENFIPAEGQLYIYGDNHDDQLAFSTDNRTIEAFGIIADAVIWYTCYLDYPQMKISEYPGPGSD